MRILFILKMQGVWPKNVLCSFAAILVKDNQQAVAYTFIRKGLEGMPGYAQVAMEPSQLL